MADPSLPQFQELTAPPGWRTAEFISDLHLQDTDPATFEAWRRYMAGTHADAVFILGDLFEAWPGDDAADEPGFDAQCAKVLKDTAAQRTVFFMHGNRDFIVGLKLLDQCGVKLLGDPVVFVFAGRRWLLSHGDLLCTEDTEYLRFRAEVRDPKWQQVALSRPLAERRAMARVLRERSEARQRSGLPYADVDESLAVEWLHAAGAGTLVHGHTHKPKDHEMADGKRRIVLSDWDALATPPRLQALRLDAAGAHRIPLA